MEKFHLIFPQEQLQKLISLQLSHSFQKYVHNSVLREWVLDNREVKSEDKMTFTLFEKCK